MQCTVSDCSKKAWSRDVCPTHYSKWRRGDRSFSIAEPKPRGPKRSPGCSIEGCEGSVVGWGWCRKHYSRWKRTGDPLGLRRWLPSEIRFWRQVDKDGAVPSIRPDLGECWLWTGSLTKTGYALFQLGSKVRQSVHRYAYELQVGPIPFGYDVDHLCFVRHCVRGSHLEAVTPAENRRRALAAKPQRPWKRDRRLPPL